MPELARPRATTSAVPPSTETFITEVRKFVQYALPPPTTMPKGYSCPEASVTRDAPGTVVVQPLPLATEAAPSPKDDASTPLLLATEAAPSPKDDASTPEAPTDSLPPPQLACMAIAMIKQILLPIAFRTSALVA